MSKEILWYVLMYTRKSLVLKFLYRVFLSVWPVTKSNIYLRNVHGGKKIIFILFHENGLHVEDILKLIFLCPCKFSVESWSMGWRPGDSCTRYPERYGSVSQPCQWNRPCALHLSCCRANYCLWSCLWKGVGHDSRFCTSVGKVCNVLTATELLFGDFNILQKGGRRERKGRGEKTSDGDNVFR